MNNRTRRRANLFVLVLAFCSVGALALHPNTIHMNNATYFQNIPKGSCYWENYRENIDWKYAVKSLEKMDATSCANLCLSEKGCTGFEMKKNRNSYGGAYCAFWMNGNCAPEEMISTSSSGVKTYILMDGIARFNRKYCDIENLSPSADYIQVDANSPSQCAQKCQSTPGCTAATGGRSSQNYNCFLFRGFKFCNRSILKMGGSDTRILYDAHALPAGIKNTPYTRCNPLSGVFRGYFSCDSYIAQFPCQCDMKLEDICFNSSHNGFPPSDSGLSLASICVSECAETEEICSVKHSPSFIATVIVASFCIVAVFLFAVICFNRRSRALRRRTGGNTEEENKCIRMTKDEIAKIRTVQYSSDSLTLAKYDCTSCTICLGDFEECENVRVLRCNHIFHNECIDEWLQRDSRCPICKQQQNADALVELEEGIMEMNTSENEEATPMHITEAHHSTGHQECDGETNVQDENCIVHHHEAKDALSDGININVDNSSALQSGDAESSDDSKDSKDALMEEILF